MKNKPKILIILGPTAAGKSNLAIQLAKKFSDKGGPAYGWNGAEIISADSRQIYKGLDIGTAKPSKKEIEEIKHHLIDIKKPDEDYSVWQFKKEATEAINQIVKKGKVPILSGGTGLYIKAVVDNLDIPEAGPDQKLRDELESRIKTEGLKNLYEELIKIDPEAVYIVSPLNPRRVIRALEVAIKTKKSFSEQYKKSEPPFEFLEIGLDLGKGHLKERIEKRVDEMIKDGLIEEVKGLVSRYDKNLSVFDAIGYREIIDYLDGKHSLPEAIEKIKRNTWQFARRQMTWFRRDKRINWFSPKEKEEAEEIEEKVKKFLKKFI